MGLTNLGQELYIEPAPSDKAVVYFVRVSSFGALINFSCFDSTSCIGVFKGPRYMRYTCEPGKHLFWVRSENKVFIEANLEAGKPYFLELIPQPGGFKSAVDVKRLDLTNTKKMKKVNKLFNKRPSESFTEEELRYETSTFQDVIDRAMEKYSSMKEEKEPILQLGPDDYYVAAVGNKPSNP